MPRPELAEQVELEFFLSEYPQWRFENNSLVRELVASNFAMIIGIVNSIAVMSEAMDHHPDLFIYGWNKLRIILSTHDKGGITELDFRLAKRIEDLKFDL